MKVTTTTRVTGGTGRVTAGPPKVARKEARRTRLRKVEERDMVPSVTNAGATGTSPATALTQRLWAKEALREEEKEEKQVTKEGKEVRQEPKEDTKVTKEAGTRTEKEAGAQEAKVIRVTRVVTKAVQEEVREETREVTEEDLCHILRGRVTGAVRRATSGKTARSRPTRLAAAQGGTNLDPWASSSRAATPLHREQEETRRRARMMMFRRSAR